MKILLMGYSSLAKRKIIPAIENAKFIKSFDCATVSQKIEFEKYPKLNEVYGSYQDAIKSSNAEFVYISTANHLHFELIKSSILHNKNVIVDKPSVLSYKEAQYLYNLSLDHKKIIVEAIVYKYHPQINYLLSKSEEIKQISVNFSVPAFNKNNFRNKVNFGGGVVYDMGPYALDIGKTIFKSSPKKIISSAVFHDIPISMSTIIEFDNNKRVNGFFGFNTEYINSGNFIGNSLLIKSSRLFTSDSQKSFFINETSANETKQIDFEPVDSFLIFLEYVSSLNLDDFKSINLVFLTQANDMDLLLKSINKN